MTGCDELLVNSTGIQQVEPAGDRLIKPGVTSTAEWCGSLSSGLTTTWVIYLGQVCVHPQRTTA